MSQLGELRATVRGIEFDVTYWYSRTDDHYLEIDSVTPDGTDTDWLEYIEAVPELWNELWNQVVCDRNEIVQTGGIDPLDAWKARMELV